MRTASVLVTGASGEIGHGLIHRLAQTGRSIVTVDIAPLEPALARKVRRAHVVAAFGTIPSEVLFDVFENRRKSKRPSMLYYGDHQGAKDVAMTLVRDVGFEPVDAGPLRIARYAEPFTLLVAQLAYEGERGPELAYRFEWLGE